jgi:hypothetical protein
VKVDTDEGAYLGCLRLDGSRSTLHDALDDGRAYLALWEAVHEDSREQRGFLVIHKSAIRQVALLGRAAAPAGSSEEA